MDLGDSKGGMRALLCLFSCLLGVGSVSKLTFANLTFLFSFRLEGKGSSGG